VTDGRLEKIKSLVGDVTPEQLRYVDCFVSDDVGVFMPVGGSCFYALTPMHTHPSYMFILAFDDRTAVRVGEETFVSLPGRISAFSPDVPHHELPSDFPPRYAAIMINRDVFEERLSSYEGWDKAVFRGEMFGVPRGFMQLLKRFMIEADDTLPGSREVLRAVGVEISHAIIRSVLGVRQGTDRVSDRMEIERAVEYIHSNLADKLSVERLAGVANMSESHFARVFRRETGLPPIKYLEQARLDRAKKLLAAGDMTVTEVSYECGFCSPGYLSDRFSKRFSVTPSRYMKDMTRRDN